MSNNANQITNEQALQILFEVTELDTLKLNAKERRAVDLAVQQIHKLVEGSKPQPNKIVELTPVPVTDTV
jgi:hypothetical protein